MEGERGILHDIALAWLIVRMAINSWQSADPRVGILAAAWNPEPLTKRNCRQWITLNTWTD